MLLTFTSHVENQNVYEFLYLILINFKLTFRRISSNILNDIRLNSCYQNTIAQLTIKTFLMMYSKEMSKKRVSAV